MSIEQMRDAVMRLYPGDGWRIRVMNMKDAQIVAIYNKRVLK